MANISHFTQTVNGVSTTYDIHDANAVDLSNNQTVGGIKTFSNAPVVGSINLDGKTIDTDANGDMTYDGHIVDTIEEQGDGYIRYSNGLQICTGRVYVGNTGGAPRSATLTFARSFTVPPVVMSGIIGGNSGENKGGIENIYTTLCGGFVFTTADATLQIIAIGRWK